MCVLGELSSKYMKIAIMKKDQVLYGVIIALLILLLAAAIKISLMRDKESKFDRERTRINAAVKKKDHTIDSLKGHAKTLVEIIADMDEVKDSMVQKLDSFKNQIAKARTENRKRVDQFTDIQTDSAYQKLYPEPDSVIFSSGSKATYVLSVQKQGYSDIIEGYYWKQYAEKSDSTISVFDDLVAQKNLLITTQQEIIENQDDKIDLLLDGQTNDLREISSLKKKAKFKNFVIRIGLPAAVVGGIYLGTRIK
jgi:predicted RND superfamily exporter protein